MKQMGALIAALITACQSTIPAKSITSAGNGFTYDAQGEYLIGKGDDIGLRVHGDESLSGVFSVGESGQVSVPLVGFVPAEGLTIKDFRSRVESGLAPYVLRPRVTAWVAARKSFRAYFCGEVTRVGMVQVDEKMTLLKGLAVAGGLTPYASKRIVVLRKAKNGSTDRLAVEYPDLLRGAKNADQFFIERGDTIIAE